MKTRHRIPSIFNLSMVDVLCCALGCVILLWLLNLRNANDQALAAGETTKLLDVNYAEHAALQKQFQDTENDLSEMWTLSRTLNDQVGTLSGQLDDTTKRLRAAESRADNLGSQLATTQKNLSSAEKDLTATRTQLDNLSKEHAAALKDRDTLRVQAADMAKLLEALRDKVKDADIQITRQTQNYTLLEGKLTLAQAKITALEKDLKEKDQLAQANAMRADSLSARLADLEKKLTRAQGLADTVPGLEGTVKDLRERFAKEEALANKLEAEMKVKVKEMLQLQLSLKDLQQDRVKLTDAEERIAALLRDLERLKSNADSRFAGVTLTGKRVVFLVDMSGSMDRLDKDTVAPNKWKGVRETLARLMRSIAGLEKYQVILFSDKAQYLLGQDEKWLDYDVKTSADAVLQGMAAIKPKDGTNMHAGLEAAFKFRTQGLDAIYLLSDGLPNTGPGLTADQIQTLTPLQLGEVLGKSIRMALRTDWNKEQQGKPRVKINCVGFFYESPDLGAFLWTLARENDGHFVGMSEP